MKKGDIVLVTTIEGDILCDVLGFDGDLVHCKPREETMFAECFIPIEKCKLVKEGKSHLSLV